MAWLPAMRAGVQRIDASCALISGSVFAGVLDGVPGHPTTAVWKKEPLGPYWAVEELRAYMVSL